MGARAFTLIIQEPERKWYNVEYLEYYLAPRATVSIDGEMCSIERSDYTGYIVKIDGKPKKFPREEMRRYRYEALHIRQTMCNHLNLERKYRYDIMNYSCNYCFCCSPCSWFNHESNASSRRKNMINLIVTDLCKVSDFFEKNRDLS